MSSLLKEEKETRERLLSNVKKEVKQLMEVAAARKFIHEDNGCIISLCATVEQCLLHGLKRRAIGLFKTSTTLSLVQKISKSCPEAELIIKLCDEYDKAYCANVSISNSNNTSTVTLNTTTTTTNATSSSSLALMSGQTNASTPLIMSPASATSSKSFMSQTSILSPADKSASSSTNGSSLSLFSKKLFSSNAQQQQQQQQPSTPSTPSSTATSSNNTLASTATTTTATSGDQGVEKASSVSSETDLNKSNDTSSSNRASSLTRPQKISISYSPTFYRGSACYKFLWIRLALLNKSLTKIVDYIVENSNKYYSPFALVADPVDGPIFCSLLIGPCALEFTRMKSCDHLWNDPNADELIQRHKMHSTFSIHSSQAILPLSNISNQASTPASAPHSGLSNKSKTSLNMSHHLHSLNLSANGFNSSSLASVNPHHHHHHLTTQFSYSTLPLGASATSPKLGLNAASLAKRKASINAQDDPEKSNVMTLSSNSASFTRTPKTPPPGDKGGEPTKSTTTPNRNVPSRYQLKTMQSSPSHLIASSSSSTTNQSSWQPPLSPTSPMSNSPATPSYSPRMYYQQLQQQQQQQQQQASPVVVMNTAKEYVESLHQNSKSQIIYGKNHVIVCQREKELAGYLSLHLNYSTGLILKWTPNQIMNAASVSSASSIDLNDPVTPSSASSNASPSATTNTSKFRSKSAYWDYAMYVDINTIVYLHCHQHENKEATIVLVAQDGVQHPPIRFPKGSHLLQFLTCLESGLAPNGQLDPPLWNDENTMRGGVGKIFPKLQRKSIKQQPRLAQIQNMDKTMDTLLDESEEEQADFVFRIVNSKANVSVTDLNDPSNRRKQQLQYSYAASAAALIANNSPMATPNSSSANTNIISSILPNSLIRSMSKNRVLGFKSTNDTPPSTKPDGSIELSGSILGAKSNNQASFTIGSFFSSFSSRLSKSKTELDHSEKIKSILKKQPSISSLNSNLDAHSVKSEADVDSLSTTSLITPPTSSSSAGNLREHKYPLTPPPSLASSTVSMSPSDLIATSSPVLSTSSDIQMIQSPTSPLVAGQMMATSAQRNSTSLVVRSSMKSLCDNMKRQILTRAFYGWLAYHRHLKTISLHLIGLVNCDKDRDEEEEDDDELIDIEENELDELTKNIDLNNNSDNNKITENVEEVKKSGDDDIKQKKKILRRKSSYLLTNKKLDDKLWSLFMKKSKSDASIRLEENKKFFYKMVYYNGIEHDIRQKVWPFLLEHYSCDMDEEEREAKDKQAAENYENLLRQWKPYEEFIRMRDNQKKSICITNNVLKSRTSKSGLERSSFSDSKPNETTDPDQSAGPPQQLQRNNSATSNEVFVVDDGTSVKEPFSILNRFPSAKNLFSKLMNTRQPSTSTTTTTAASLVKIADETENLSELASELSDKSHGELKDISMIDKDLTTICNETIGDFNDPNDLAKLARDYVTKIIETSKSRMEDASKQPDEKIASAAADSSVDKKKKKGRVSFLSDESTGSIMNSTPMSTLTSNLKTEKKLTKTSSKKNLLDKLNENVTKPADLDFRSLADDAESTAPGKRDESLDINLCNQIVSTAGSSTILSPTADINKDVITTTLINMMNSKDKELLDSFALNIHRIDKDVTRCDRNYWYFTSNENLNKLRNIMYTYVWENLNIGYIQGMCDLVAPLLVIFDNEPMVYSCFKQLMKRMSSNFPHGTAMDQHFSNMRSLIQILDSDLFEHMHHRGDYTHFFFSYRWFLLDFKRELKYDDVFHVWETIWAAKYVCSAHFYLFIALALVETYRDIIIDNNMDFTDIIKFFNEMAEKHNTAEILALARTLIKQLQDLIDNNKDSSLLSETTSHQ